MLDCLIDKVRNYWTQKCYRASVIISAKQRVFRSPTDWFWKKAVSWCIFSCGNPPSSCRNSLWETPGEEPEGFPFADRPTDWVWKTAISWVVESRPCSRSSLWEILGEKSDDSRYSKSKKSSERQLEWNQKCPGWPPRPRATLEPSGFSPSISQMELREFEGGFPKVDLHASCKTRQTCRGTRGFSARRPTERLVWKKAVCWVVVIMFP
jgi:hypothetical protein